MQGGEKEGERGSDPGFLGREKGGSLLKERKGVKGIKRGVEKKRKVFARQESEQYPGGPRERCREGNEGRTALLIARKKKGAATKKTKAGGHKKRAGLVGVRGMAVSTKGRKKKKKGRNGLFFPRYQKNQRRGKSRRRGGRRLQ